MSFLILYVTHPSKPEAVRVTAELLNTRLIACANYFPIESMYHWDGRLINSQEIVTIYKTIPENHRAIEAMIEKNHINSTPCIMKFATVDANAPYEEWIKKECLISPNL